MNAIEILGLLGIGSVIGIVINHFLDSKRHKKSKELDLKSEAYAKAIAVISGLGNRTVQFTLDNHKSNQSAVGFIGYLSEINEKIAPAILFSSKDVQQLLREVTPILTELNEAVENTLGAVVKKGEGTNEITYEISTKQEEAKRLGAQKKKIEDFEEKVIEEMKKDMNI